MKRDRCKAKIRYVFILFLCIALSAYIIVPFFYTPNEESYNTNRTFKDKKLIALTFDDGPSDYTNQLLDVLDEYDAKATFFVLGKKVGVYRDTISRMDEADHLIGNHTYNHKSLFGMSHDGFCNELSMTDDALMQITGRETEFFRPPYGRYLGAMLDDIDKYAVLWSYDTKDWKHPDADYVYEQLVDNARDGAIILMHDTKKTTVEGVARAIEALTSQGYEFVTVDALLCRNGKGLRCGLAYRACKDGGRQLYF